MVVQKVNDVLYLKRGDLYKVFDVNGMKSKQAYEFIVWSQNEEKREGVITAGSKMSPQTHIVSNIAFCLGLKCRIHTSYVKEVSGEVFEAGKYAEIVGHSFPRTSNLIFKAKQDAKERNWIYVPFGMQHKKTIQVMESEVLNIPKEIKTIVISLGSGASASALVNGLEKFEKQYPFFENIKVIGVRNASANPVKNIERFCVNPKRIQIIKHPTKYNKEVNLSIKDIDLKLDPIYEAKVWDWVLKNWNELEKPVLFWIVGVRKRFDMVKVGKEFYSEDTTEVKYTNCEVCDKKTKCYVVYNNLKKETVCSKCRDRNPKQKTLEV